MAMIKTMKGEKSNFHISAISIKPSCKDLELIRTKHKEKDIMNQENEKLHAPWWQCKILTTIRMVMETA